MEDGKIILVLILFAVLAYPIYGLIRAFLSLFDHGKWKKNSTPSAEARIVDMKTEKVQYVKNGTKYRTTVLFSDGFTYITHKTDRSDNFFTYSISISPELRDKIVYNAEKAHQKAVIRYYSKKFD